MTNEMVHQIAQCRMHLATGKTVEWLIGAGFPAAAIREAKK